MWRHVCGSLNIYRIEEYNTDLSYFFLKYAALTKGYRVWLVVDNYSQLTR